MKPLTSVFTRLGLPLASLLLLSVAPSALAANDFWAAVPGTSATTNWTDAANWTFTGQTSPQTYYNQVEFIGVGANANNSTAVNNVLDAATGVSQMPIWELDYAVTNGNYTTLINPGVTLTLGAGRGFLYVGADQLTGSPAPANAVETITITGSGAALSMAGSLYVSQGSTTPGDTHNVTLDLSGLDNFSDTGSEILIASSGTQLANGTLYLAKTNQIALAEDFQICNQSSSNSVPCAVYLGQANSILTGTSNLVVGGTGTTAAGAWMKFNPAFLGGPNPPTASLGGTGSDSRIVNFLIGNANGGAQVPGAALVDFTGGSVSLMARTMQLGQGGNPGINSEGTLTLDNGVINVNNATNGSQELGGGGAGIGVINLNTNASFGTNATLIVNNTLTLAATTGTLNPATAGTINLNGGALSATRIVNGGGTATINSTGGTISLASAGTPPAPVSILALTNSTLNLAVGPASTNIFANLTTGGAGNVINITSVLPSPAYPVVIRLIKYPSSIGGAGYDFALGTLPALTSGFLSNDTVNASVDLVLTAGPLTFTWTGSVNDNWDTTTANWTAGGPVTYTDGDFVQFLDGANTGTVNLTAALSPGGVTISNNALSYSFTGSGNLTGAANLVKEGSGTLVLDNSGVNSFTGGLTIGSGAIVVGNNDTSGNIPSGNVTDNGLLAFARTDNNTVNNAISGTGAFAQAGAGSTLLLNGANSFSGEVVVTNNSTLQLGSSTALGNGGAAAIIQSGSALDANGFPATKTLMVSGTGVNGNGALTDTGGSIYDRPGPGLATNIILTGDTTFTYPVRWDLGSPSVATVLGTDGQARNLTLNSSSGYFEWYNVSVEAVSNITVAAGNLGVLGNTTFGDPNGTLVLTPSGALTFYGPNVYVNKQVDFQNGASINVGGGNNTMNGGMTLESGFCTFNIGGGTSLALSNVFTGAGVFYQSGGTGTSILSGNSPSFTGGVNLFSGTMIFNGTIGSGITTVTGTTLSGTGTANGLVDISGAFYPGGASEAGTFTSGAGLTLESPATLTMDLAATTGVGGGTNDLIAVTGNLTVNGNNIVINPLTGALASGTYVLMTYSGSLNGSFGTASTIVSSRYSLSIDTSVAHQVRLIVSGVADVLAWNNGSGNSQWDVQSSLNWTNLTTHTEDQFFTSDSVLLDDRGGQGPNASTTLTISAGQIVSPSVVTNNSTTNYTISGQGKISGGASIVKLGPSTLTISTTNDFTGSFTIGAGAVQLEGLTAAAGAANGTLVISNGATVAVNLSGSYPVGDAGFGNKPIIVSGTGANGQGAIQFSGGPLYSDSSTLGLGQNVTLTGNTTISGTTRFDWGYPGAGTVLSTRGSNYSLGVTVGGYSQWYDIGIDTNLGNIDLSTSAGSQQTMAIQALGVSLGNPTNVLTLNSNILFNIQHGDTTAGDSGYAKIVHVLPTAGWQYQPSGGAGDYRLATSFILETNATFSFFNGNGGSGSGTVINGTVVLNGLAHLQIGDSTVTFSNVISGTGGFYWDNYNNTVLFTATNTYQGTTDIRSGRTLALAGNGSISASTNISLAASAVLDVSGRVDQRLTLADGQTLQGDGAVNGNLTVGAGAAIAPGGVGSIGTLTVSNSVTLSGTTEIDVNQSASTEDQLNCAGGITYGGVLNVGNLAGTLAAGDTFQVFNAASYSGAFTSITPEPGPGLAWDPTALATGALKVVTSAVHPKISGITISGGNVILRGTNNTGTPGTYHVLTTTNITVPLANWTVLTNGSFDSNGNFSSTNALGTSARQFYILQVP